MKKKWLWALGAPALAAAAAAVLLPSRATRAADHIDGPRATNDPSADITDVYAFMSPDTGNGTGHLVLAMDVFALANASSKFSDKVDYVFEARQFDSLTPTLDAEVLDVTCNFDATVTNVTCKSSGGNGTTALTKTVSVGTKSACMQTDKICVFAGLRSDPFYFDLAGFKHTIMDNKVEFTGANFFDQKNVLSIVVELDVTSAFGAGKLAVLGPKPVLAVAAKTNRRS